MSTLGLKGSVPEKSKQGWQVVGLGPGLLPMARKICIEHAGAAYHVMARGNQGRDIYADDRDRRLWLETLGEACEKTGWRIHAWVMINNH